MGGTFEEKVSLAPLGEPKMIYQAKYETLMAPILIKFGMKLRRDLFSYQAFQKHLGEDVFPRDIYEIIKSETHKIAGSAKTLGFEELGAAAFEVEKCIKNMLELDSSRLNDRNLIPIFEKFLSILKEASAPSSVNEVLEDLPISSPLQASAECHVLVIDDDVFSRDLVKLSLRRRKIKISEAATGLAGISFLKDRKSVV